MTEVATTNSAGSMLAIRPEQESFNKQQIAALKKMNGWDDVPAAELSVFFHQAQRTGLDPFARQIYLIGRKNNRRGGRTDYTIQTSIDGMRLVADRTGRYAGSDRPQFANDDGERCCEVTVWKVVGGQRVPFTGVAYDSEYRQDYSPMWKKMPRTMLAKCAEAQALRKAFPADLSGIYGSEEMDQAGPTHNTPEELGAEVNEDGEVIDIQGEPASQVHDEAEVEVEPSSAEADSLSSGARHAAELENIAELIAQFPDGYFAKPVEIAAYAEQSYEQAVVSRKRLERLLDEYQMDGGEEAEPEAETEIYDGYEEPLLVEIERLANELYSEREEHLSGIQWLQREQLGQPVDTLNLEDAEALRKKLRRERLEAGAAV